MEERWIKKFTWIQKKHVFLILIIITILLTQMVPENILQGEERDSSERKWKIFHIMSYHSPWKWTDDQFEGFKYALKGLDVEYRVFQMDTKQKSTKKWKQTAGKKARELIDTWKPDLVYTSDDNAQEYVTRFYVNSDIPFVFSGVNAAPATYGFSDARNITGVLEHEHFVETVYFLKEIVPGVKKIAIIIDDGPTWPGVIHRIKVNLHQLPDVEFVSFDVIKTFRQYQHRIEELQKEADAVGLLGIFTLKGEAGENVPYRTVLRWTADHSRLPDFSFWKNRVSYGTLCSVNVSGYQQGLAAGKIARGILVDGRTPSSYPFKPTVKGEPILSLARANKLGIRIRTQILLSAQIIENFKWEE